MTKKRVEVLFDPEQYARLERIAKERRESVGALIREAVQREYLGPTKEEKLAAVARIAAMNIEVGDWEEIEEEISREILSHLEID